MIRIDNLHFTYPGAARPALDGLSLEVGKGEVYGLLGPSGAGKSTTQRILMGLLKGYTGTVEIFGQPIATLGRGLYERIGVSFELPALYLRLTARENLRLFAALYQSATISPDEVLAEVDLSDAADQRVETFSKGMKMRLNLARSLLHDPELLFLDEPTTGQDPNRSRMTRDLILKLKARGKTIFLTTHNMAEAEEICDRVGFLVGGRIPVTGAPVQLKRQYGERTLDVRLEGEMAPRHFPMEGLGGNSEFLALLAGGRVAALHTMEASLDDVFIRTTKEGKAA
jgi:fluoroquinolone transport system ATP-binding protein